MRFARPCTISPPTRSRRAPPKSTRAINSRAISGPRSARSACTASPSRRNMAARGWAISSIASRSRRFRARRPRSACPTARIPIFASTSSAATATRRRSAKYLPKLISGEHVGSLAMSEPGCRLRRGVDGDARREEGRPLRPQRQQDVDHQRPRRRDAGGLCQDRSGRRPARHHRLHHRKRHEGIFHRAKTRQARHARLRHRRTGVRQLRGAGGERARRGRPRRQRA